MLFFDPTSSLPLSPVLRGGTGSAPVPLNHCDTVGSDGIQQVEVQSSAKAQTVLLVFETLRVHPLGYIGFIALLVLWTVAALPLTPVEVCAGSVYGFFWGSVGSQVGKTIGCILSLLIGRHFKTRRGWKVPRSLDQYLDPLKNRPFETMCIIRLSPLPLGVKNYGLSLVHFPQDKYPVAEYVWAAFLCNLPYSVMWALTGRGASSLAEAARRYA